jgi:hypothetical protein
MHMRTVAVLANFFDDGYDTRPWQDQDQGTQAVAVGTELYA